MSTANPEPETESDFLARIQGGLEGARADLGLLLDDLRRERKVYADGLRAIVAYAYQPDENLQLVVLHLKHVAGLALDGHEVPDLLVEPDDSISVRTTPHCDPQLPSDQSPVPHDYERSGEEFGSLAEGGSYWILRCRRCGRVAYTPMAD